MYAGLILLLFLMAEIAGTVAGFGSSAFFISLGQFVFGFKTTLALTSIQHVFGNITKIVLFNKNLDWKLILYIGIPSLIMTIAGAYVSKFINSHYSNILLGSFLLLLSSFLIVNPKWEIPISPRWTILGGGTAGFLAGTIGTGGAVRGMLLSSFNLEKNIYVGTSAFIDLAVDFSRSIIYLSLGYLSSKYYYLIVVLLAIAIVGSSIGKFILNRISQDRFRKITLITLFILGLILIIREIKL